MTNGMQMADGLLVALLVVATVTDVWRQKIYNWTTYPGLLAGLILGYLTDGRPGLEDRLLAVLLCGGLMVLAFVLLGIGGGDVKLIAMMAAFLGLERGVEAMLWTFVFGAIAALGLLIWRLGTWRIIRNIAGHLRAMLTAKTWVPLTEAERKPLERGLYLAPSALAAVSWLWANDLYQWIS
jgi:prepilin peptidase CpaA